MQPVVLSSSIEIKKSDYQNVSQAKNKNAKSQVNIDQTKQKIIAGIIAAENEALGIDKKEIKGVDDFLEHIDVKFLNDIDGVLDVK